VLLRNDTPSSNPKLLMLNELLSAKKNEKVSYHHFTDMLINEDGSVKSELFDDHVHLNPAGYQKWSELLGPLLASFV
jgi:lysophospholipase L1-like esterase